MKFCAHCGMQLQKPIMHASSWSSHQDCLKCRIRYETTYGDPQGGSSDSTFEKRLPMSPYQKFLQQWNDCQRCKLHEKRTRMVFAKGGVPADILLIGEGPGPSEDILGKPFVGPAGKLLDGIVKSGLHGLFSLCYTNLVCCIPLDDDAKKFSEPPKECIRACEERLVQFVELVNPKVIVAVGDLARRYALSLFKQPLHSFIIHPAAILRMDATQQPLAVKRCVATLEELAVRLR